MDTVAQLRALIASGNEADVRTFVVEHFSDLPENLQKELGVLLFKEALQGEIQERDAILAIKKEAVAMIDTIEQAEREEGTNA